MEQRIQPLAKALWEYSHPNGGPQRIPIRGVLDELYRTLDEIYDLARMSREKQAANMGRLDSLRGAYQTLSNTAKGIEGVDETQFRGVEETLAQLQAQYPQSQN